MSVEGYARLYIRPSVGWLRTHLFRDLLDASIGLMGLVFSLSDSFDFRDLQSVG